MPSTSTLLLLAAIGYGAYVALKPTEKEASTSTWVEPKHDLSPEVKIFIKPDDPPARDTFTDISGVDPLKVLNPPTYKPDSFTDRYIKRRGFPAGW